MQIIWTNKASRDMEEIYNHISQEDKQTAIKVLIKIKQRVNKLIDFPKTGLIIYKNNIRKLLISKLPYFAFYIYKNNTIKIIRIYHTSRKFSKKILTTN